MVHNLCRDIPDFIDGYGPVKKYGGREAAGERSRAPAKTRSYPAGHKKLVPSLDELLDRLPLRDGMTLSFHHHFRNGDLLTNMVMLAIAERGYKDIHLAISGIFPCHDALIPLLHDGVITKITTSTFNPGGVAKAISRGELKNPCVLMSHGGRARAIESGGLHINIAFIASPAADENGNLCGYIGKSACGVLSYMYADAQYADYVVAVTDDFQRLPLYPREITQDLVDYVLVVDKVGDPAGIVSGTTKITEDPIRLKIAESAANVIEAAGLLKDGFSFQTGASGTALAVAEYVKKRMIERNIQGSFGLGGITGYFADMLDHGLFKVLYDTQDFDLGAVSSINKHLNHIPISSSLYASPDNKGAVVNYLDAVILGATEIDLDFNVNVVTGSNGMIIGASGGHSDCAAGAKLTIVVANLTRKKFCVVRDRVTTVTTPGSTVDVLVTEHGIAVNPNRPELETALKASGLEVVSIKGLKETGESIVGPQSKAGVTDRIVGVVEYRDGSVIDLVYQVADGA